MVFNEKTLRDEIVRIWGPAGAHVTLYDMILEQRKKLLADMLTISKLDKEPLLASEVIAIAKSHVSA